MKQQKRPLLSVCIIFKNEARCLERCLQSLSPLKDAIPCEIVMADTGSTDQSYEIASQFADELFEFPWIDDFSAARNAVIERARGKWLFTLDADEWLEGDLGQLVQFLKADGMHRQYNAATLVERNTIRMDDNEQYIEFLALRIFRKDDGIRYVNAIHETLEAPKGKGINAGMLDKPNIYHDGYADGEILAEKRTRNIKPLLDELESAPYNLKLLMQCIESSSTPIQQMQFAIQGIDAVRANLAEELVCAPIVYRYAVQSAATLGDVDRAEAWLKEGKESYPDSIFLRLDGEGDALRVNYAAGHYETAIEHGLRWRTALADYKLGKYDQIELLRSTLVMALPVKETELTAQMFDSMCHLERWDDANLMLEELDLRQFEKSSNFQSLCSVMFQYGDHLTNIEQILSYLWGTALEHYNQEQGEARKVWVSTLSALMRLMERQFVIRHDDFASSPVCNAIAKLDQWEPGHSARLIISKDSDEIHRELECMENWDWVLPSAYAHAIAFGVRFPESFFQRPFEAYSTLAAELAMRGGKYAQELLTYANAEDYTSSPNRILWMMDLLVASLQATTWACDEEGEALWKLYICVEREYLSIFYRPELLSETSISALPAIHRFGWYCIQADEAIKRKDKSGYLRLLRAGLATTPAMKGLVDFLAEQLAKTTPSLQKNDLSADPELQSIAKEARGRLAAMQAGVPASLVAQSDQDPELLAIAAQLRDKIAAMREAGIPGAEELLNSPAYQKFKPLIEGMELVAPAGLKQ